MCEKHQQDASTEVETPAPEAAAPEIATPTCCGGEVLAAPATPVQDDDAECPVMPGTLVNKAHAEAAGLYRDHNAQRYWFCCTACAPMWDADPDEYAAA